MTEAEYNASLTRRLILLGNQISAIAGEVATSTVRDGESGFVDGPAMADDSQLWLILANEHYRERSRRAVFFPAGLFGEPAWDILLDLYAAAKRNEHVSISSACIAAQVPPTTALRWLGTLEVHGLVERKDDKRDARRHLVSLTYKGYANMTAYFAESRAFMLNDDFLKSVDRKRHGNTDPNIAYIEAANSPKSNI